MTGISKAVSTVDFPLKIRGWFLRFNSEYFNYFALTRMHSDDPGVLASLCINSVFDHTGSR